jgi:hypothetical protein
VISATIENYPFDTPAATQDKPFNREGLYKLHDGGRLVYRQPIAGPNRYEVYDARVHAAEGWRSDAEVTKRGGPTLVSVYSDTLLFDMHVTDPYEPRSGWDFERAYDPYLKCWGYDDLVWCTYVGGSEEKTLFRTVLRQGDRTRLRVSLDNNTGVTLTNLSVAPQLPPGITATPLYTDATTAPEPIWSELSFLNRTEVPDAWRSVWYFELEMDAVDADLLDEVLEIPIAVSADGLPDAYTAPPARVFLQGSAAPSFVSAPASDLTLTDTLPADVRFESAVLITDAAVLNDLWTALDADAGNLSEDTAGALFETLVPTHATALDATVEEGVVTYHLPAPQRTVPPATDWHLVTKATLLRAGHGTNVVNEGPTIAYTDPLSLTWTDEGPKVTVEAHGAAVWVDYECEGGYAPSFYVATQYVREAEGQCTLPDYGPVEVEMDVTAHNEGDAIARAVTVTLALPEGITVTEATPRWQTAQPDRVTWEIGDLAPGAWKTLRIVLTVRPTEGRWGEAAARLLAVESSDADRLMGIHHSDGAFIDAFSDRRVAGQVGGPLWFDTWSPPRVVYLPVLMRRYDTRPDLVVEAVTVDPADPGAVAVTVRNDGLSTARDFWVDLYLDPSAPPETNQPWPTLCYPYGATWYVAALAPDEPLVLRVEGAHYRADYSRWPEAYPGGAHEIWAYADSWGDPNPWGGVSEVSEDNNRYGPVSFEAVEALSHREPDALPFDPIPSRPRYPEPKGTSR